MKTSGHSGFTFFEMCVGILILAVLGFLSAPAFNTLIAKSKEGNAKGGLATLRGALEVYKADNGAYPQGNLDCLKHKYLMKIPKNELPGTPHEARRHVTTASETPVPDDSGGWYYDNRPESSSWGQVHINCNHSNSMREVWSEL